MADRVTEELIDRVMTKIEEFYFEDGENNGEAIFHDFASQHHHVFDQLADPECIEHKLE